MGLVLLPELLVPPPRCSWLSKRAMAALPAALEDSVEGRCGAALIYIVYSTYIYGDDSDE